MIDHLTVRPVRRTDLAALVAIFADRSTPTDEDYWIARMRWHEEDPVDRSFLVADVAGTCVGAITGEVRAREFRSTRVGTLFAVGVADGYRESGVGTVLFEALSAAFLNAGVELIRAMVPKDEALLMAFLRSQGMRAGPFVQMEVRLRPASSGRGGVGERW